MKTTHPLPLTTTIVGKPKFRKRNKNMGNNEVIAENKNTKPVFNLIATATKTNQTNNPPNTPNVSLNNNQTNPRTKAALFSKPSNRQKITPLGQSLDSALKGLTKAKLITLLCPTAKTGLYGGAAFLALDGALFWLICQMLTLNARSDYEEDEEDVKGHYGQVTATDFNPPGVVHANQGV